MYKIKQFFKRIRNLYRWFPVIWKDQDWDDFYIFEILKFKLKNQAEYIGYHDRHVSAKRDAEKMMLCVRLIDKVQNEEYLMELVNNDVITKEMIDKADAKHNKARRLLFEILENYIEKWWD
jgi:hypothetical protein